MAFLQILAILCVAISLTRSEECSQGVNCHLPDCFCPTFTHPLGAQNIPQIVYFGFDDAVTPEVSVYFKQLFTKSRRNPNGCPITMSLYVCNRYTIYSLVKGFFKDEDEIAVHSVDHTYISSGDKLRWEAQDQKRNIERGAKVPGGDIIGWRSPDLITAGDDQPRVLKELNFTYDISLPYDDFGKVPFPFTLDFGYPYPCSILPCPGRHSSHKGFWEVPINTLFDPVKKIPCTYVDGCRPSSEEEAYQYLMSNFYHTYYQDRAPFGLNMHAAWFYFPMYLAAMDRFIQTLVDQYQDVYIVNVRQMMAWMKTPKTVWEVNNFAPWGCKDRKTDMNKESDKTLEKGSQSANIPAKDLPLTNIPAKDSPLNGNNLPRWLRKGKNNSRNVYKMSSSDESPLLRALKNSR